MIKKILPLAIFSVLLAAAALMVANRQNPTRESLLPIMQSVKEQEKAVDRSITRAIPLSPQDERRIGEQLARELSSVRPADGEKATRMDDQLKALGADAETSTLVKRFRGRYEFHVTPGPINAFALPGGFVFAMDGLMARFSGDSNALLFVIGHEIGHVELGHCADNFRTSEWFKKIGLGHIGDASRLFRGLVELQFSEVQELEADEFGLRIVAERRRDPQAALRAMDLLGLKEDSDTKRDPAKIAFEGLTDFFRTHPGGWSRRSRLKEKIESLSK